MHGMRTIKVARLGLFNTCQLENRGKWEKTIMASGLYFELSTEK